MAQGETATGLDETGRPWWQGHRDPGGNQSPASPRGEDGPLPRPQVQAGITGGGIAGQGEAGIENLDREAQHAETVAAVPVGSRPMLVWMDLEMTGLDTERHVIVEIATLVTDDDLVVIAEGPDLVIHQPEEALAAMDPVVVEMHTGSGLLEQIRASTITLEEAGETTLAFLREHVPDPGSTPLCGNSIGTDRRFLVKYLPAIEDHLHYRSVDVSTIKELARRWYPEVLAAQPRKATAHRALDDIRESVSELRFYRERLFLPIGASYGTDDAVSGAATGT